LKGDIGVGQYTHMGFSRNVSGLSGIGHRAFSPQWNGYLYASCSRFIHGKSRVWNVTI